MLQTENQNTEYENLLTSDDEDRYDKEIRTKKFLMYFFIILLFFFGLKDIFTLNVIYGFPKESYSSNKIINPKDVPLQEEYKTPFPFKYSSFKTGEKVELDVEAKYVISGYLVAENKFINSYFNKNFFNNVALIDFGLVSGKYADLDFIKEYLTAGSSKGLYGRWLTVKFKKEPPVQDSGEVFNCFSHVHIIPATKNVYSAALKVKKYQKVSLLGYLVDVKSSNGVCVTTSLSRTDTGGNACEIMYVQAIKIDNKVYQ